MNRTQKSLFMVLAAACGAIISRWHGGGFKSVISYSNKTVKNIIWALPFGIASGIALFTVLPWYWAALGGLAAFGLCLAGKATGHGRVWNVFIPLKLTDEPEALEWPIKWLIGRIPDTAYKMLAMGLIGFAAVSGAAIAFWYVNPLAGLFIAFGGFFGKVVGYMLGFARPDYWDDLPEDLDEPNEIGESFTGWTAYLYLALAFFMVVA